MSTLGSSQFRIPGLIIAGTGLAILITLLILNFQYEQGWFDRIMILNHYIIVLGLVILTSSKEAKEDERVHKIRYSVLRVSFRLVIVGILLYLLITTLDRVNFSVYVIIYIVEAVLVFYQVLFRIGLRLNPQWMLMENTKDRKRLNLLAVILLIFIIFLLIFDVIFFKLP